MVATKKKHQKRRIIRALATAKKRQQDALIMRSVDIAMPSRAVIATETPVAKFDEQTGEVVQEVLLMDGVEFRAGRDQLPIVDSHDDKTVRNIFGSIRNIRADFSTGQLIGIPTFASDEESQTIARRVAEGHITDFSITAIPLETTYVQRGKSYTTPRGEIINGPALIHTRWQPLNASICATGADEHSKVLRSYTDLNQKVQRMDEALLGQLSSMGLPEGMTDPNQVLAWVVGKLSNEDAPESAVVENMEAPAVAPVAEDKPAEEPVMNSVERSKESLEEEIKRHLEADQKRRNEIQAACTLAKVERAFADELCNSFVTLDEARKRIIERMAQQPLGTSAGADVRVTGNGNERFYSDLRDGLIHRAYQGARINRKHDGDRTFAGISLKRAAELLLRQYGVDTTKMNETEIARAAMGNRSVCRQYKIERDAYHTTGTFTNLMLDAANKSLLAAYEEAPYTWQLWARQAPSVADFKNINRIRFSESPDPEMVPENKDYKEKVFSDSKETYSVNKYGALFTVSWETVVNDDLDAISRIPAMHGAACRRKVNKEVYSVLTSNPTMGDGFSLFSSSHVSGDNTSGASAAPSVTTLNAGFVKMMTQKGLSSDVVINVQPRFLIVPVALSATALQLTASLSDPLAGGSSTTGNANTLNIYGPNGMRPLTVVVEPTLDASSASVWYLAADNSQIDTVEVSFLQGEESPVLEEDWDMTKDVYLYKVRQTFGVKAIDWRGLYRNA